MKRNKHSLSHYKLYTTDMAGLVPVSCIEVLPGDTVQQATSLLVRVSPLLAPVMHPVSVRIHHWFVPNRLVWDGWEDFITGGPDGQGGSAGPYPVINAGGGGFAANSLTDYLGVPPLVPNVEVSALPVRAYNKIVNEFYRDQDLQPERIEDDNSITRVNWEKDYFTSARPFAQKGPDVSIPLGVTAPVISSGVPPTFSGPGGNPSARNLQFQSSTPNASWEGGNPGVLADAQFVDSGLLADLTNATAANINDVRRAFAIQRYQEARSQYGSRYTEYLRYLGVRSSDARLQRPEYLGGGKQTISFSEVLRTGSESTAPIGEMFGHGIAAARSRRYRRFFEEHGHVLSLASVRPRTMYNDGVDRMFNRRTKEDYWQKELEHIGQQEVLNKEIYAAAAVPDGTFGYQDRYADYRHVFSKFAAEFRTTLNYWHMGRIFASEPVLNGSFVRCDPTKRIHAEQTAHALWVMAANSIQARRLVTRNTIGRIM